MTHKEFLKHAGMELRVARVRCNMTAKDVAKITGLSRVAILRVERGERDSHILTYKRIADALGVSMKDIM